ncbi:hypothetical protein ACHAWC_004808 [Mediolabrus comicus]
MQHRCEFIFILHAAVFIQQQQGLQYSSFNNDYSSDDTRSGGDSGGDRQNKSYNKQQQLLLRQVEVAGVSVSPLGFLVILQSVLNNNNYSDDDDNNDDRNSNSGNSSNNINEAMEVAFPIQLTSSGVATTTTTTTNNNNNNNNNNTNQKPNSNLKLPSLFQENIDQNSVSTPEALTFLQLLNGVDMATPILSPDILSLICVWYAFLMEERMIDDVESGVISGDGGGMMEEEEQWGEKDGDGGGLMFEDELGLEALSSTVDTDDDASNNNIDTQRKQQQHEQALNYIRGMVRTTLPPSKDGSYFINYIDASNWQRSRVQLPRVWLHGVRIELMDLSFFDNDDDDNSCDVTIDNDDDDDVAMIGRVPIQYTLECSVDDGLKRLEIPLFAIPSSYKPTTTSTSSSTFNNLKMQLETSNDILQEVSHNYNVETSASFLSLALYHRYSKSGAGSADSPTLQVHEELLTHLIHEQQQQTKKKKSLQFCWPTSIRSIIQANGLPMYRPLHQIKEEDQRVLERIYEGSGSSIGESRSSSSENSGSSDDNDDLSTSTTQGSSNTKKEQQPKKKPLTLEQQALQQRLKSAWKIAMQKGDEGALEKIQKAMEDLEKELIIVEEEEEDDNMSSSTLDVIQRAMRERDERRVDDDRDGEEGEMVGLISDLEEATLGLEMEDEEDGRDEAE